MVRSTQAKIKVLENACTGATPKITESVLVTAPAESCIFLRTWALLSVAGSGDARCSGE